MSAGHGHTDHGHAAHGHDEHGHGAAAPAVHAHGGEIPSAPAVRHITPAPQDFVGQPGPGALLYPILWCGAAALLISALLRGGWTLHDMEAHGSGEQGASEHGAPEHGEAPAPVEGAGR